MSHVLAVALFAALFQNPLQIGMDHGGGVRIEADQIPVLALLEELDRVVGTESTLPDFLATRRTSIRIGPLPIDRAIQAIFSGLALDYAVVGNRIIVLGESERVTQRAVPRQTQESRPIPTASADVVPVSSVAQDTAREAPMPRPSEGSVAGRVLAAQSAPADRSGSAGPSPPLLMNSAGTLELNRPRAPLPSQR